MISCGCAQEKYDVKRCSPKLLNKPAATTKFQIKPGEKYRGTPVVSCEIAESGEVQNVKLVRSSGVRTADEMAVEWVKLMRYNARPGCGVIATTVGVTIDFIP